MTTRRYCRTARLSATLTAVLCVGAILLVPGSAVCQSPTVKPLTVKWLDVTTVLLDDGQNAILVDGYFSRYPAEQVLKGQIAPDDAQIDAALKRAGITKLDVVLTAHSHIDHALDTPVVAAKTGAVVAGSESTANIARGLDFPENRIRVIKDRDVLHYGDFKITVIQSPHSPGDMAPGKVTEPLKPPASGLAYKMGATTRTWSSTVARRSCSTAAPTSRPAS